MSRLVNSWTVEIRLTIFPATLYNTIHRFTTRWWRIFCGTRSRAGASTYMYIYKEGFLTVWKLMSNEIYSSLFNNIHT